MSSPDLPAVVAVVERALDELGEICSPVDAGLALAVAGLSEIGTGEDQRAVLVAYRATMDIIMTGLAGHGVEAPFTTR